MHYKLLLLMLVIAIDALENSKVFEDEWQNHIGKHKMKFQSDKEYQHRKSIFKAVHDKIEAHNNKKGNQKLVHNKFSTMTNEEISSHYGYIPAQEVVHDRRSNGPAAVNLRETTRALPTQMDLRSDKCMGAIKNQKSCGSCWTFAATAVLEFNNCVKTGLLKTLSEQQIVDCTGRNGCQGGDPVNAWNYIVSTGGQNTDSFYSYSGTYDSCKFSSSQVGATISPKYAVIKIASGDVNTAMAYLANRTALSTAMDSVGFEFQHYQKGTVFTGPCSGQEGHAIAIVGYGTSTDGIDYWLIRNSWDTCWGDSGYAMIKRGANICGIENYMVTTTASTGDAVQTVNWSSSPGGYYNYSNCGYAKGNLVSSSTMSPLTLDDCGNRCVAKSTCNYFTFSQSVCTFLTFSSSSFIPIAYSDSTQTCGSVVQRFETASTSDAVQTVNWTSSPGGYYNYSNCGYAKGNLVSSPTMSPLTLDDCGNSCVAKSTCNYFTFSQSVCTFLTFSSSSFIPIAYSDSTQTCGSVVQRFEINWITEGQLQYASNCDFQEAAGVSVSYYTLPTAMSLSDCKNFCLTTYPGYCNHFTLSSSGTCIMKLSPIGSKPTPIYSSANSNCGWVPTRL